MDYLEQLLIHRQIKEKFYNEFEIECPPKKQNDSITNDKELILDEFVKWYNFWDIRDPILTDLHIDLTSKNNKILFIKKDICELKKVKLLNEIVSIGLKEAFFDRINNKNNIISKIRKRMEILNNISKQLYDECIKEFNYNTNEKDIKVLDPVNWLVNQENMRILYESYTNKTITSNNILTEQLIDNKFIRYMKFMYDNYPIGFGKELLNKYKNKEKYDSAEIYYEKLQNIK